MAESSEPRKRWVLLAVVGQSPQVITETIYALAREKTPVQVHRVVALTTSVGARKLRETLQEQGWLARLCADWGIPPPALEVCEVRSAAGKPLKDIVSEEDHFALADACIHWMRKLTNDPDCRVHASIAGGRKTMSFFLGYAFGLFAREEDRLSHVLVDPAVEGHPEFFYPPPKPKTLRTRDGDEIDVSKVEVRLAEIPVLRLRERLPANVFAGDYDYRKTLALAEAAQTRPWLEVRHEQRTIVCNGVPVQLEPALFAIYCVLLARGQKGCWPGGKVDPIRWDEFVVWYPGSEASGYAERLRERAFQGFLGMDTLDPARFAEYRSRINARLGQELGEAGAEPFQIVEITGKDGQARFRIAGIDPKLVKLEPAQGRREVGARC